VTVDIDLLAIYLHLAWAAARRRRPLVRDRLLVLAGVVAIRLDLPEVAAYCRQKILEHNPAHLVRRWPSLEAALQHADFQSLLQRIGRRYPRERAEQMIDSLGLVRGRERDTYQGDLEYAAALLETNVDQLRHALRRQSNHPDNPDNPANTP